MNDELRADVESALNDIPDHSKQDVVDAAERVKAAAKELNGVTDYPYPEEYFEWIVPYFERFHQREPSAPEGMISELHAVRGNLEDAAPIVVAGTEHALNKWEGQAASSFSRFYAAAFRGDPGCVGNQIGVVDELRASLWLYMGILKGQRADAIEIADATVRALEASDDMKTSESKFSYSALAAMGTILGAVTTGGLSVGVKIIGGAASLAAADVTKEADGKTESAISGTSVPEILNNMAAKLDELDSSCNSAEEAIGEDLSGSVEAVRAVVNSSSATELMKLVPNEIGDDGTDLSTGDGSPVAEFRPAA